MRTAAAAEKSDTQARVVPAALGFLTLVNFVSLPISRYPVSMQRFFLGVLNPRVCLAGLDLGPTLQSGEGGGGGEGEREAVRRRRRTVR